MTQMVLVNLQREKGTFGFIEPKESESRLFSTKEKAEEWLKENHFVQRPRTFFEGNPVDWCREGEWAGDYVQVTISEAIVDAKTRSIFTPLIL